MTTSETQPDTDKHPPMLASGYLTLGLALVGVSGVLIGVSADNGSPVLHALAVVACMVAGVLLAIGAVGKGVEIGNRASH